VGATLQNGVEIRYRDGINFKLCSKKLCCFDNFIKCMIFSDEWIFRITLIEFVIGMKSIREINNQEL
jgi:hypothetical protein